MNTLFLPVRLLLIACAVIGGTLVSWEQFYILLSLFGILLLWAVFYRPSVLNTSFFVLCMMAFIYGQLYLQQQRLSRLPLALDRVAVTLLLSIEQVEPQTGLDRLYVRVLSSAEELKARKLPALRYLRINHYHNAITTSSFMQGQVIQAEVVLRSPRNLSNGLTFDYEAWLLGQNIDATGYIRQWSLVQESTLENREVRSRFLTWAKNYYSEAVWPWLAGLVFGEQQAFSQDQWALAQTTGTLHLLVVSGLHMGMVVLLSALLWGVMQRIYVMIVNKNSVRMLWWRGAFLLFMSALYLWLAGSGIALQRAWLMLAVLLMLHSIRWNFSPYLALSSAFLGVLLVNPLAWVSAGFAYSFAAVTALILFFTGRKTHWFEALWLPQVVVFVALFPLFLWWQQPVGLQQILANLVAIPYLNFVLLPLALLNLSALSIFEFLLDRAGEFFWVGLTYFSNIPLPFIESLPKKTIFLWLLWLIMLQLGLPRYWILPMIILVLWSVFNIPTSMQPQARLLDVGQGQSLVFTTENSSLVYDTGPALGNFDSGESIVKPVLKKLGARQIDLLVVSHRDNDHSGGTSALLNAFPVHYFHAGQVLSSVARIPRLCAELSHHWQVLDSSLLYRYLFIPEAAWNYLPDNSNNRSCLLQVRWYNQTFLLVGDIAKPIEYELIRQYGTTLKSDVLVLGHHGSDSSSSHLFLTYVNPKQVWISSGFNNRYQHPHQAVLERLSALHIPWYNTAELGALWLLPNSSAELKPNTERGQWQPPWRNDQ